MSQRHASIPPSSTGPIVVNPNANDHFRAAADMLRHHTPVPPREKFPDAAREVRMLTTKLLSELESPTSLEALDRASLELGQKCLEIQRLTLKARARGAR